MKGYLEALARKIERFQPLWVIAFFLGMILTGFLLYSDYGIPWDDPIQRQLGLMNWAFIHGEPNALIGSDHANYGPLYELFLVSMEKAYHLEQLRDIYLLRHALTYVFFCAGAFFFYLLCLELFRNWKIGLLGCVMLFLSPRIFENAFYNTKDIPFLSLFIICVYLMLRVVKKPNLPGILLLSVASAALIAVRNVGIFIPILSFIVLLVKTTVQLIRKPRGATAWHYLLIILYLTLTYGFLVLMWPALWHNPFGGFWNTLAAMANYDWQGTMLFMGNSIPGKGVPWYYIPVSVAITTPLVYSLLFLIGALKQLTLVFKGPASFLDRILNDRLIILATVIGPVVAVIVLKSTLYDSWRQMFFIYPGFLIIALAGLEAARDFLIVRLNRTAAAAIIIGILMTSFVSTLYFMVRYHPHQAVYFNRLAGADMQTIKSRFDMDYWGLSYYDGLKYLAQKDPSERITIFVTSAPGKYNTDMLPDSDQTRFHVVYDVTRAKYLLSDYRWHPEDFSLPNEIFNITVGNAKIMVVYQLKPD